MQSENSSRIQILRCQILSSYDGSDYISTTMDFVWVLYEDYFLRRISNTLDGAGRMRSKGHRLWISLEISCGLFSGCIMHTSIAKITPSTPKRTPITQYRVLCLSVLAAARLDVIKSSSQSAWELLCQAASCGVLVAAFSNNGELQRSKLESCKIFFEQTYQNSNQGIPYTFTASHIYWNANHKEHQEHALKRGMANQYLPC